MRYNLASPFLSHAEAKPKSLALVVDGASYSYEELWGRAARVAGWLARTQPAGRVGILGTRCVETYAALLGICAAGGTYVPLSPKWPIARMKDIIARSELSALALAPDCGDLATALADAIPTLRVLVATDAALAGVTPLATPVDVAPDHVGYIIFTSGSTGVPKGVSIKASGVDSFRRSIAQIYDIGPADRVAQFSQLSFDFSVFEMFATWQAGASLWVVPEGKTMSPAEFIRESALTVWASVPSVIALLCRLKQLKPGSLPSLRISIFSGEALLAEMAEAWRQAAPRSVVDNHWGATEITVMCTLQRVTDEPHTTSNRSTIALGQPYPGTGMAILDAQCGFVADGEVGELAVAGPQLAEGYFGDPEKTRERFVTVTAPDGTNARWYRTGDLAYRDPGGLFHYQGRNDTQIKVRGYRIELGEIEARAREVARTDDVAAVAWPCRNGLAEGIVLFVGASVEPTEVLAHLRAHLPIYMLPSRVVVMGKLAENENGKIDRRALTDLLDKGSAAEPRRESV